MYTYFNIFLIRCCNEFIWSVSTVTHVLFLLLFRGLYLTSIFYRDDNILVTPEDQIPIVEVEDSYSSSLMQDFLWFTKVDWKKERKKEVKTERRK